MIQLIDSYRFGTVVVSERSWTSDVIIFPDRVIDGWQRREGHRLYVEDLKDALNAESRPKSLVVGTGHLGLMKVSSEVEEALRTRRVGFMAQRAKQACQTFNDLLKSGRRAVAALHLTC